MDRFSNEKIKRVQYKDTYSALIRKYPSANRNMDDYVLRKALDDKSKGKGLTFLFVNENEDYLYGYYSLFSTSIVYSDDESGEFLGIPSVELKMFAINEKLSGELFELDYNLVKYSDMLLGSIMTDIYKYSEELIGIGAVVLRSTPRALNFYLRNNFIQFHPLHILPYEEFSKDCISLIYPL